TRRPVSAPAPHEQFGTLDTQLHAGRLGMWTFLASESLIFGGLFALYSGYRAMYGADFTEAIAHNTRGFGTANTFLLITSSFTVALAVGAIREDKARRASWLCGLTALLGCGFLVIKTVEYLEHAREGLLPSALYRSTELPSAGARLFYTLYW